MKTYEIVLAGGFSLFMGYVIYTLKKVHKTSLSNKQKLNQMAITLDQVLASVTENATVGDSIVTLLNGVKRQLDEALSGTTLPAAVQEKVDAIFAKSEEDKQKLADAITANTPSEG